MTSACAPTGLTFGNAKDEKTVNAPVDPRLVFLSGDLVFAGRVRGVCANHDVRFYFGGNLPDDSDPAEATRLVVLDLATRGGLTTTLVPQVRERFPQAEVVAYAPHVHKEKLAQAVSAGFDFVLTRGQFDSQLSKLVEKIAAT